jgi:hypothetical protein
MHSLSKHDLGRVFGTLGISLLLAACSAPGPGSQQAMLAGLAQALRFQYHNCVPLGWQPVSVAGTYYPGFTATAQSYAEFLDAIWRGRIATKDLRNSSGRAVFGTLNHLMSAGLLDRKETPGGYNYFLKPQSFPYYFGSSLYGDNRDRLQYLCYSTIVPQKIVWSQRIPYPKGSRKSKAQWYRVLFTWMPSSPAAWANDPYFRKHSIVLAPIESPTAAKMYYYRDDWHVVDIYDRTWMLPATVDATAQK